MFKKLMPAILSVLLCATSALADEAAVKKAVESRFGIKVESVTKSGYLNLFEVFVMTPNGGKILYTDEKVSAIVDGVLVDAKTKRDITEERMSKLTAIKWSDLPLERAIKQVRGDGKRVLATFEDPNCGYCKRLAKELLKLDNVTIYTFLLPILSPDSELKSKQIWCASDRAKAWNDWMVENKAPPAKTDCDTSAVVKNQEYGRKLNITGTPTLFFADGERIPGAVPLPRIEEKLAQQGR